MSTNSRKNSVEYFHALPENLNCAQSILKGFQEKFQIGDEEISEYRAWGGGRAEGGVCGALFAAENLLNKAGASGIEDDFASIAGDTRCIEIKQGKFPCPDCVRLADELITRRLEEKDRSIG